MLVTRGVCVIRKNYYGLIDKLVLFRKSRWFFTLILVVIYFGSIHTMSFDIASYLIGFYLLQLVINYFTPKGMTEEEPECFDSSTEDSAVEEEDFSNLAHSTDKPLIPSMSEIQIWERSTSAFVMGIICTYSKLIEIDAFWPLLMIYFIVLVCYTIHKIITKMERYRYNIFDFSKQPSPIS